jgi:Xaa-Pro aminopeptidase
LDGPRPHGTPTGDQRRLIEACAGIVETIIDAIEPGVTVLQIAELGERLTEEAGGGRDQAAMKWPIYGHGLGLFWEKPDISTVFAEFDIIVNEVGTELLTTTPMLWWD